MESKIIKQLVVSFFDVVEAHNEYIKKLFFKSETEAEHALNIWLRKVNEYETAERFTMRVLEKPSKEVRAMMCDEIGYGNCEDESMQFEYHLMELQ